MPATPCTCPRCGGPTNTGWVTDLGHCYDCQRLDEQPPVLGPLPTADLSADPFGALARIVTPTRCVGCFQTKGHARGCPTGQNGSPRYD